MRNPVRPVHLSHTKLIQTVLSECATCLYSSQAAVIQKPFRTSIGGRIPPYRGCSLESIEYRR